MERCRQCGQVLGADHRGDITDPPDIPLVGEGDVAEAPRSEGTTGAGRAVLIGFAAFGTLWMLASIVSGQSSPSTTAAAVPTETSVAATVTPAPTAEPSVADEIEPVETAEPKAEPEAPVPIDRAAGNSVNAGIRMLQGHLERSEREATILYRSTDSVSSIDLRSGDVQVLELGGAGAADVEKVRLFESGDDVIVVDPIAMTAQLAPRTNDRVIIDPSNNKAIVFNDDERIVSVVDSNGDTSSYDLSDGDEITAVAHYAFIVNGEGGVSYAVTADGVERLSSHRVITATPTARLELRCENIVDCTLVIVSNDGEATLPQSFSQVGDRYLLSPDGLAIIRWDASGRSELHVPEDSYTTIVGTGVAHPVWSPDSSFVTWLDLDVEPPRLKTLLHERREWLLWDVSTMGAPDPTGSELIIW